MISPFRSMLLALAASLLSCFSGLSQASVTITGYKAGTLDYTNNADYQGVIKYLTVRPQDQNGAVFTANGQDNATVNAIKAIESSQRMWIFWTMQQSTEAFKFATLADAKATFSMRVWATYYMREMNAKNIPFSYCSSDSTTWAANPPSTTGNLWTNQYQATATTTKPTFWFRAKDGTVVSSDAIDQILNGTTVSKGECAGAITLCVLGGARKGLSTAAFNTTHPNGSLAIGFWAIGTDARTPSWDKHTTAAKDTTLVPGDRTYISNIQREVLPNGGGTIPSYDDMLTYLKTYGAWRGENVLVDNYTNAGSALFNGLYIGGNPMVLADWQADLFKIYAGLYKQYVNKWNAENADTAPNTAPAAWQAKILILNDCTFRIWPTKP